MNTIDLYFSNLRFKTIPSDDTSSNCPISGYLLATYATAGMRSVLSARVLREIRNQESRNFWEAASAHPGCSVSMSPLLSNEIRVKLTPIPGRDFTIPPLFLEIGEHENRVHAYCDQRVYRKFCDATGGRIIMAGELRQRVRLTLGRAVKRRDEFGFRVPILKLRVTTTPRVQGDPRDQDHCVNTQDDPIDFFHRKSVLEETKEPTKDHLERASRLKAYLNTL